MSKDYKVQWTPELRKAVDDRIIDYLSQGYSQQEAEDKALQDQLDHTTFNFSDDVVVTAKAPQKKQVAVETDWDPGYTKFMSGQRYYADNNHKNYLDQQRNDMTNSIRETTDKWGNAIGTGVEIVSGFTPLWWVAPAVRTGLNLSEGDYKGAALNAGLAFAAPYAVGKGLQFITPHARTAFNNYNRYRNIRNFTKELNKNISKTQIRQSDALPLEDGFLFHNGHTEVRPAGFDGKKFTYIQREVRPGALKTQNGKYTSVREPYGDNQDMLWWDTQGHNYGKEVYVTRQSDDAVNVMSNMRELPISQISERYQPSYYVTKQKPIEQVIKYTYNPITGYTPSMPGKILTNRMSYDDILQQPVISSVKQPTPSKTSLAFFERSPSKISKAEKAGIPKGMERTIVNNEQEILANAKSFAEKYGYEMPETIDAAKAMYNQHNSFFRTPSNHESVILHYDPELTKLPLEQQYFKLASKGYPESMRSYDFSKNGIYSDDFVFVAPDYGEVMPYINDVPAVMLRRPFRKSNPLTWHKDAEWTIQSKYTPYDQVFGKNKIGTAQIGNAGPQHEFKVSTRYLHPVKIAEPADKGTLLGIHLGPYEYKSGGSIHIKKKNKGKFSKVRDYVDYKNSK